jgi:hypothetical protein
MPEWIYGLLLGAGIPAGLSLFVWIFAKYCPKEETFQKRIAPFAEECAMFLFLFMGRWLKPVDMEKVEEGFFKTLAYWLDGWIHTFMAKLDFLVNEKK